MIPPRVVMKGRCEEDRVMGRNFRTNRFIQILVPFSTIKSYTNSML